MRSYHPERIIWYCPECKQTGVFLWVIDAFLCVGEPGEQDASGMYKRAREGCGHQLRLKDYMFGAGGEPTEKRRESEDGT